LADLEQNVKILCNIGIPQYLFQCFVGQFTANNSPHSQFTIGHFTAKNSPQVNSPQAKQATAKVNSKVAQLTAEAVDHKQFTAGQLATKSSKLVCSKLSNGELFAANTGLPAVYSSKQNKIHV
jgi:hypothetical protein